MLYGDIHPIRKAFRGVLLVILGAAIAFFAMIVTLRIGYRDAAITGELQTKVFEADIAQHRVRAYFGGDQYNMVVIGELFQLSFFSPMYYHAGMRMLEDKANAGFPPARTLLAEINPQSPTVQNK